MRKEMKICFGIVLAAILGAFILNLSLHAVHASEPTSSSKWQNLSHGLDNLFRAITMFQYYTIIWLGGTLLGSAYFAIRKNPVWARGFLCGAVSITTILLIIVLANQS